MEPVLTVLVLIFAVLMLVVFVPAMIFGAIMGGVMLYRWLAGHYPPVWRGPGGWSS